MPAPVPRWLTLIEEIRRTDSAKSELPDTGTWDANALVEDALPAIVCAAKITPVFKYLKPKAKPAATAKLAGVRRIIRKHRPGSS